VEYTQQLLDEIGLGRGRLEMFEIAASDAPKWVAAVKEMTRRVEELGPNPLRPGHHLHPDKLDQLEDMVGQ
jgi:F420-non-reducing hydrogenase iron-sulfur subunit